MAKQTKKLLPSEKLNKRVGSLSFIGDRSSKEKISYGEFKKLAKQAEKTFNFDESNNRQAISL